MTLVNPELSVVQVAVTARFESLSDKVHVPSLLELSDHAEPEPWYELVVTVGGALVELVLPPPPHAAIDAAKAVNNTNFVLLAFIAPTPDKPKIENLPGLVHFVCPSIGGQHLLTLPARRAARRCLCRVRM